MASVEPPRLGLRVARGLALLELLAFEPRTAPASAAALGFDPRTARRLLRCLAGDQWVRPAGDRRWEPTLRLAALAAHLLERSPLVRAAGPALRALADSTGAPAELAVPSYDCALTVLRAERGELVPLRRLDPAAATPAGRVLLAHRTEWCAGVAGVADTGLAERLERIRREGVEPGDPFAAALPAVPVAVRGEVVAALACGPPGTPPAAHVRDLRRAAAAIVAALA